MFVHIGLGRLASTCPPRLLLTDSHYEDEELARVPSERGAKTAHLVPELRRLYVAVGGSEKTKAGLLRYEVVPGKAR